MAAAVAAVVGLVAGATLVGMGPDGRSPAAADVPARVLAAQDGITAVDGTYTITESGAPGDRGDGPDSERVFSADLTYRAPENLSLRVRETTQGRADPERAAGDLVVDGDGWRHDATRDCSPAAGLVHCPSRPLGWASAVTGRAPTPTTTRRPPCAWVPPARPLTRPQRNHRPTSR